MRPTCLSPQKQYALVSVEQDWKYLALVLVTPQALSWTAASVTSLSALILLFNQNYSFPPRAFIYRNKQIL